MSLPAPLLAMLAVGVGGFLGAVSRYGAVLAVEYLLPRQHLLPRQNLFPQQEAEPWPIATLVVNVLGSFLLGMLWQQTRSLPDEQRLFLTTGLLGAFTTFSTFSVEILLLLQNGRWLAAGAYFGLSTASGLAAAWCGWRLAGGVAA